MAEQAHVIILNGVSSVGKSATARALQVITRYPFLHVAMDAFLAMLPAALIGHVDGLRFEAMLDDEGEPAVNITGGAIAERTMIGMRHAVAAMAAQGGNLVVDVVLTGEAIQSYRDLLAPFRVSVVGLFAALAVTEDRERRRGNRALGLARWQHTRLHGETRYDFTVDTSYQTPEQVAAQICARFALG